MHICKECGKSFEKPTSLGAHIVHHKNDFSELNRKSISNRLGEIKTFDVKCYQCEGSTKVNEREKLFPKKEKYFCSQSCSTRYASTVNPERNSKISKAGKGKLPWNKIDKKYSICTFCNSEFEIKRSPVGKLKSRKTCSDECYYSALRKNLSGKTGGYRSQSGTGKKFGDWYREVWFDSKWEIEAAKSMERNGIEWIRGEIEPVPYKDKGDKSRLYHPDFYIIEFDCYLEIKGYMTEDSHYKLTQAKEKINLAFIYSLKEAQTVDRKFFQEYDFIQPVRGMKWKKE